MNEEEKQAYNYLEKYIEWETLGERNLEGDIKTILDLVEKQQKEIEFYKIQELEYIQGYEDGKSHKQTAVAIKNENAQYELIRRDRENLQKQIESYKERYENMKWYFDNQKDNLIHKDKIKEIIENHKKFLVNEFSHYADDDIENRKAIQYALARLSFLLTDILKED